MKAKDWYISYQLQAGGESVFVGLPIRYDYEVSMDLVEAMARCKDFSMQEPKLSKMVNSYPNTYHIVVLAWSVNG